MWISQPLLSGSTFPVARSRFTLASSSASSWTNHWKDLISFWRTIQ